MRATERGGSVSKHYLQGYLNFLSLVLNTDAWFEQIVGTDFFT